MNVTFTFVNEAPVLCVLWFLRTELTTVVNVSAVLWFCEHLITCLQIVAPASNQQSIPVTLQHY